MATAGLEAFDKTVQQPHIGEVQDIAGILPLELKQLWAEEVRGACFSPSGDTFFVKS